MSYQKPNHNSPDYLMWFFTLALSVCVGVFFAGLFLMLCMRAYIKSSI